MDILPTHTCFDDALDTLERIAIESPDTVDEFHVIHAICMTDGELFSHAWLEHIPTSRVVFVGIREGARETFVALSSEYEAELSVQWKIRYRAWEAVEINHRTNHYGPWEPVLRHFLRGG